jgi:hypothetical protein
VAATSTTPSATSPAEGPSAATGPPATASPDDRDAAPSLGGASGGAVATVDVGASAAGGTTAGVVAPGAAAAGANVTVVPVPTAPGTVIVPHG